MENILQLKVGSIYYIEWEDHWACSGWYFNGSVKEDLEPSVIKSIGWVVGESEAIVRIAGTIAESGGVNQTMNIIKKCIINAYELKGIE